MFEQVEALLLRQGVERDCVETLLHPWWIACSRSSLGAFGGRRRWAFDTEMRSFRFEHPGAPLAYRLFKYLVVGTAALVLGPRLFYKGREWYGQRGLQRLRERLTGRASVGARPDDAKNSFP